MGAAVAGGADAVAAGTVVLDGANDGVAIVMEPDGVV